MALMGIAHLGFHPTPSIQRAKPPAKQIADFQDRQRLQADTGAARQTRRSREL
jgi:hypothetical protein